MAEHEPSERVMKTRQCLKYLRHFRNILFTEEKSSYIDTKFSNRKKGNEECCNNFYSDLHYVVK